MRRNNPARPSLIVALLVAQLSMGVAVAGTTGWTLLLNDMQFGKSPMVRDLGLDRSGNIYQAGDGYFIRGSVSHDMALLVKHASDGRLLWLQKLDASASSFTVAYAMAISPEGDICVGGATDGSFSVAKGKSNGGFVARLDTQGQMRWVINSDESVLAMALTSDGECYAASATAIEKYDKSGRLVWRHQAESSAIARAPDGTLWYLNRPMYGVLPRLVHVNTQGREIHVVEVAIGNLLGVEKAALYNGAIDVDDMGNIYLQGSISAEEKSGHINATYLAKLDSAGKMIWERYHCSEGKRWDSFDLAVDGLGRSYLAGRIIGLNNTSSMDAFAISYDANGTMRWLKQFGTNVFDGASRIAADNEGNYVISGGTEGDLDGLHNVVKDWAVPFLSRNHQ